jgi:hypothetical protein
MCLDAREVSRRRCACQTCGSGAVVAVKKLASRVATVGLVVLTFAVGVMGGFSMVVLAQELHLA